MVFDQAPAHPSATFEPDMVSNPLLRDTVVSSGYGSHVPPPRVITAEKDPHETFDPKLESSKEGEKMRLSISSTGYGRGQVPVTGLKAKQLRAERPKHTFQPQVNRSKYSKQIHKTVTSTGLGRKLVHKSFRDPDPIPQTYFQPKIVSDPAVRANVPSSGYGKKGSSQHRSTSQSPSHVMEDRELRRSQSNALMSLDTNPDKPTVVSRRVSMHTLLDPEAQPNTQPEEDEEFEVPWVADGERLANHLYPMGKHKLSLKYIPAIVPEKELPTSPLKEHFDNSARSFGYGSEKYEPLFVPRKDGGDANTTQNFGHVTRSPEKEEKWNISSTPLQQLGDEMMEAENDLEVTRARSASKKQYAHVGSTAYGQSFPPTTPRADRPAPKEAWLGTGRGGNLHTTVPDEAPATRLMIEVDSAGYGRISPPKAYRAEREPAAVWVPPSAKPNAPALEPAPTSKYKTQVRTQYDHQYFPE
jgi:hypothetical protein